MNRHLALACLVSLAIGPAAAVADPTYSVADLSGGYAFTWAGMEAGTYQGGADRGQTKQAIGTLVADGHGLITGGTRKIWVGKGAWDAGTVAFVQHATGTYVVGPDGSGTAVVTWLPTLPTQPWMDPGAFPALAACDLLSFDADETIHFALTDSGFAFFNESVYRNVITCHDPRWQDNDIEMAHQLSRGFATRQETKCCEASGVSFRWPTARTR